MRFMYQYPETVGSERDGDHNRDHSDHDVMGSQAKKSFARHFRHPM